MKSFLHLSTSSILAGVLIGIAGFAYLATGGVVGAVLFAFGLLGVVHFQFDLFTGKAGIIYVENWWKLIPMLIGNIIGTFLVALLAQVSPLELTDAATNIVHKRLELAPYVNGLLAIGCGIIMTTAVTFAKRDKFLPLLFGVPVFILCGFPHCIADAFYYLTAITAHTVTVSEVLPMYGMIVLGNFLGCNLFRFIYVGE